jgi:myo-inositol-1(or 4)-monophosphatase
MAIPVEAHRAPPDAAGSGLERELSVATDAARRAGTIAADRYERIERIMPKSAHDVVTEVDTLAEELIIASLRAAFPTDHILAEESGSTAAAGPTDGATVTAAADAGGDERLWIIDPLDGTVNYANGIPFFCVSIGLAIGGRPRLGVLFDPVHDEIFCAVDGGGATLNGHPVRNPAKEQMSDMVVSLALPAYGTARRQQAIKKRVRVTRTMGSAALSLVYVANGRFDGFVQPGGMSLWDVAAAGLIASEGGATVTDAKGGPWFAATMASRSVGIVAAPPPHHRELLELLRR